MLASIRDAGDVERSMDRQPGSIGRSLLLNLEAAQVGGMAMTWPDVVRQIRGVTGQLGRE